MSGREDLNLRPYRPERYALPDCATPRLFEDVEFIEIPFQCQIILKYVFDYNKSSDQQNHKGNTKPAKVFFDESVDRFAELP